VSHERSIEERQRLLGLTADYLLEYGVLDLRLRTLGDAIGSSHRVLLYYFASKEELVTDALEEAARKSSVRDATLLGPGGNGPVEEELLRVWNLVSRREHLPLIRLFLQIVATAVHDTGRYSRFLESLHTEWIQAYSDYLRGHGLPDDDARSLAAEIIGLQRGLQFELAIGGEKASVDRSFAAAAEGWAARIERVSH
jgi:AcrR family transcriptional regulator